MDRMLFNGNGRNKTSIQLCGHSTRPDRCGEGRLTSHAGSPPKEIRWGQVNGQWSARGTNIGGCHVVLTLVVGQDGLIETCSLF